MDGDAATEAAADKKRKRAARKAGEAAARVDAYVNLECCGVVCELLACPNSSRCCSEVVVMVVYHVV